VGSPKRGLLHQGVAGQNWWCEGRHALSAGWCSHDSVRRAAVSALPASSHSRPARVACCVYAHSGPPPRRRRQALPAGVFADPYELAGLEEAGRARRPGSGLGSGARARVFGAVDLEALEPAASPTLLALWGPAQARHPPPPASPVQLHWAPGSGADAALPYPACPAPLPSTPGAVRLPAVEAPPAPPAQWRPRAPCRPLVSQPQGHGADSSARRAHAAVRAAGALWAAPERSPLNRAGLQAERSLGCGCLQVTPCGAAVAAASAAACAEVTGNASASARVLAPHGCASGAAHGRMAPAAGPCLGEDAALTLSLEAPLHARHAAPQPAARGRGWPALAGEPVVYALQAPRVLLRCMPAQAQARPAAEAAPAAAGMPGRCQGGLGAGSWGGGAGAAGDGGGRGGGDGRWRAVGGAGGAGGAAQAAWQVPAGNAAHAAFAAATTAAAFGLASALIVRAACMHSGCAR